MAPNEHDLGSLGLHSSLTTVAANEVDMRENSVEKMNIVCNLEDFFRWNDAGRACNFDGETASPLLFLYFSSPIRRHDVSEQFRHKVAFAYISEASTEFFVSAVSFGIITNDLFS